MCCVSKAWANSELENRRTLWRALALLRWPNLGLGLQIDWRHRYRVLLQNGKPADRDKLDDPLADYAFVLQGRWGSGGAGGTDAVDELGPAFSGVVAAKTYAAHVSLHGNELEFKDAFQIDLKLRTPVPLPRTWLEWTGGASRRSPSPLPLDVTVLVQQRSTDAVAHFLTFSVRHEAVRDQLAVSRPEGEEGSYRVLADTTLYPTAAGCGVATVDAHGVRSRTESPWLTNMVDTFPAGLESLITGFRLEVCPLMLHFSSVAAPHGLSREPQLCGITFGVGMLVDGAGGAALEGALPLCVKEVPSTFDHLDWV